LSRFTVVPSGDNSRTVATSLKIWTPKSDSSINGHISSLHGIYSPLSGPGGYEKKSPSGNISRKPSHSKSFGVSFAYLHTNNFFSTLTIGTFLS
jgi:hypothetical protein